MRILLSKRETIKSTKTEQEEQLSMSLKNFAWDIFEETGDPEAYLLYKELRGFEEYADEGELLPEMKREAEEKQE